MTTLTHRDPGPDKKAADMSDSDEAGQPKGADLSVAKGGASPTAAGSTAAENFADRRRRHAWVPVSAALLTMLIGLSDIIAIFKPGWPHRLHKLNYLMPGTLTNVARSSDVIIGLLLLLLAHGLRRRKRRARPGGGGPLPVYNGIHFFPPPRRSHTGV